MDDEPLKNICEKDRDRRWSKVGTIGRVAVLAYSNRSRTLAGVEGGEQRRRRADDVLRHSLTPRSG